MMNARGLKTTKFNGKPVNYQGVLLEGTPRLVFWGDFFEPFMFDAAQKSLEWVIDTCRDRNLTAIEYLSEATALLNLLVVTTYEEMARTDQLLSGRRLSRFGGPDAGRRQGRGDEKEDLRSRSGLDPSRTCGPSAPRDPEPKTWNMGRLSGPESALAPLVQTCDLTDEPDGAWCRSLKGKNLSCHQCQT